MYLSFFINNFTFDISVKILQNKNKNFSHKMSDIEGFDSPKH